MRSILYLEKTSFADPPPVVDDTPPVTSVPDPPVPPDTATLTVLPQIASQSCIVVVKLSVKLLVDVTVTATIGFTGAVSADNRGYQKVYVVPAGQLIASFSFPIPQVNGHNPVYTGCGAQLNDVTPNPAGGTVIN